MKDSKALAALAYHALAEKKGEDLRIIDISEVSSIADYFLIATGNNPNQLMALQDAVEEAFHKAGLTNGRVEGNSRSTWILMDYRDVIVHLFSREDRLFYDLERVWRDGKELDPEEFS